MRTIIILLVLVISIVLLVLWAFFKDDSRNLKNMFKNTTHKNTDTAHIHTINTKYFEEGLELIEFHNPELKYLKEMVHTHIIGMDGLINAIIINILCGGHVLVE